MSLKQLPTFLPLGWNSQEWIALTVSLLFYTVYFNINYCL